MSAPYVDTDLYMDTPFNALTKSSDIIENQLRDLGISLDTDDPVSAQTTSSGPTMQPLESIPTIPQTPLDALFNMDNTTPTSAPSDTTTEIQKDRVVYNGPKPTNDTLGQVAESYGIPSSFKSLIDDAQDAFVGIIGDLTKSKTEPMSYQDIFGKENRLRGLGSLLIIIGVLGVLLGGLTK